MSSTLLSSLNAVVEATSEVVYKDGILIVIAPDRNVMGYVAGTLALWRLAENPGRKTLKLARAPSQVEAWETLARQLREGECGENTRVFFMDEIRGGQYQQLWKRAFVAKAAPGVFAQAEAIDFGDGSRSHALVEAERLNHSLADWTSAPSYTLAIGGTSPSFENGVSECHIAFHREDIPGDTKGPYMAIQMSAAGSRQQEEERVVSAADSICQDWVVSMTAHTLAHETDDLILIIPENRGRNLYRILHESPDTLPAAMIRRHPRLQPLPTDSWPSVVIVTIRETWQEALLYASLQG